MLMQTSSVHRKTAIFFGVKHSSGHKTQEIVKTRVFVEALWLIYRAGVDPLPLYSGGHSILMQTSSLHRKLAIFSWVKRSFGLKTQEVVKIREFQEAPLFIYRAGLDSSPPYLGGYSNLMQTSSLYRETATFSGVENSSGHKT